MRSSELDSGLICAFAIARGKHSSEGGGGQGETPVFKALLSCWSHRLDVLCRFSFQRKIEEEVEKKHKHVKKQEFGLKKVSEELTKANQIIQRLQNETKSYHEKVRGSSSASRAASHTASRCVGSST